MMNKFLALILTLWALPSFGQSLDINLLANPGFEAGKARWTASGGSFTISTTSPYDGVNIGSFDASGSSQTLKNSLVAVTAGLAGRACMAGIWYKADSITAGDYTLYAEDSTSAALTTALSLNPTSGAWQLAFVSFICPTAGTTIRLVVNSAVSNPAAISLDDMWLGSPNRQILTQDPTEIVTRAYFPTTSSCTWSRTNTALGAFSTTAACPAITVESSSPIVSITTTDTDLPQLVYSNLPAGTYSIQATFSVDSGATSASQDYAIYDGSSYVGYASENSDANSNRRFITVNGFFNQAIAGAKTFAMHCAAASSSCTIDNGTATGAAVKRLTWTVTRYPSSSTSKVTLETQGWRVDANITGANPSLGVVAVTSYTELTNGSLSMTLNTGSATATIPCSTTNPPTGLTCAAGSESLGVSFTPPYAGAYLVCADFTHTMVMDVGDDLLATFQLIETPTNAQTVTSNGNTRVMSDAEGGVADQNFSHPLHVCGTFNFTSPTQKVVRLMYTQSVSSVPDVSSIDINQGSSNGSADFHITVLPLTQVFPQAIALSNYVNTTTCTISQDICTGTYNPTFPTTTNIDSIATNDVWSYTKIGNMVFVRGRVTVDTTTGGGTGTLFQATLPIPSNIQAVGDCTGSGVITHASLVSELVEIDSDSVTWTTDRCEFYWRTNQTSSRDGYFNYQYTIH